MEDFIVVIPARFASTRLPGKPLLDILGKTMIQRVYEQALRSSAQSVVVATDDERIVDTVLAFNGKAVMTKPNHVSGTDRLQETAAILNLADDQIVVNVQGDEPLIPSEVIDQVANNLAANQAASAATLCEPITELADFLNPNAVKVVADTAGSAMYFSRAPIPWPRDAFMRNPNILPNSHAAFRHIGIYAYRVALLNQFVTWPVAALEAAESLEQLRILAWGRSIHVAPACAAVPGGVDTPSDLEAVRHLLKHRRD